MDDAIRPTWNDIHEMTMQIGTRLLSIALGPDYAQPVTKTFQHVAGVSRGGLIPGVILSHELGLPLACIDYSSQEGKGDDKRTNYVLPDFPFGHTIILIDDISDSGNTLGELNEYYCAQDNFVFTAALYYKDVESKYPKPNFYCKELPADAPWVVFPWE